MDRISSIEEMPFEESNFSILTKSNFSLVSNNISGLNGTTPLTFPQGKKPQRFEYYEPVSENSNEDCANFQSQTQSEFNAEQPHLEVVTQKQEHEESYLIEETEPEQGEPEVPNESGEPGEPEELEEQEPEELEEHHSQQEQMEVEEDESELYSEDRHNLMQSVIQPTLSAQNQETQRQKKVLQQAEMNIRTFESLSDEHESINEFIENLYDLQETLTASIGDLVN